MTREWKEETRGKTPRVATRIAVASIIGAATLGLLGKPAVESSLRMMTNHQISAIDKAASKYFAEHPEKNKVAEGSGGHERNPVLRERILSSLAPSEKVAVPLRKVNKLTPASLVLSGGFGGLGFQFLREARGRHRISRAFRRKKLAKRFR